MIWLSSDHHFGHANIIRLDERPFNDVEDMNRSMIGRWNARVKPEDTVLYLGDFSLSKKPLTEILPKLHGEKHLIAGNHDHCHPSQAKSFEKRERLENLYLDAGFKSIRTIDVILLDLPAGPTQTVLHHMPYLGGGDHTEMGERYQEFRPVDQGHWLLHGHVHKAWKKKGRMINVGAPVWDYAPVSLDEIKALMKEDGDAKEI